MKCKKAFYFIWSTNNYTWDFNMEGSKNLDDGVEKYENKYYFYT